VKRAEPGQEQDGPGELADHRHAMQDRDGDDGEQQRERAPPYRLELSGVDALQREVAHEDRPDQVAEHQ
jgi:hypothetical protein